MGGRGLGRFIEGAVLNGLDLFSGTGGLSLALAPWVWPVAYCEVDPYCRGVLLSRMAAGDIPLAPIWDDVRTFDPSGGFSIDIIYGGFPCQDISVAGNGAGLAGERSGLVSEIFRLTDELRPAFVFLENVPAIRLRGLDVVIRTMATLGYDCRWDVLSAYDVGAPHKRERWFLLAANTERLQLWDEQGRGSGSSGEGAARYRVDGTPQSLADAPSSRQPVTRMESEQSWNGSGPFSPSWWLTEPDVGRVADGVPKRVDRLRALGNAVVPAQAREAFRRLMGIP